MTFRILIGKLIIQGASAVVKHHVVLAQQY